MDLLPLNFQLLVYCGLRLEDVEMFSLLEKCWGYFLTTIVFYFTLTQVIELYIMKDDIEELIDVMFLTVTLICLCLKILNFRVKRSKMIRLVQNFRTNFYKSTCAEEEALLQKYVIQHTQILKNFLTFTQSTGLFFCLIPIITLKPADYVTPYKTYQFYDDSTTVGFFVTYIVHFFVTIFGISINIAMDTLIYGFITLATGQFDLVNHRIIKSVTDKDKDLFRQSITHHAHINKTVSNIQQVFISVIFAQFILSLLTLCATIFQMAQNNIISVEFLGYAMYLSCIFAQVFLYCWYGNELKLKNELIVKNICECNWIGLDIKDKNALYFILLFANKDCRMSWKGQCPLSIKTFVWILKTSYSAFSVLQRASDDNK